MARIFPDDSSGNYARRGVFAHDATELELDHLTNFKKNNWKVTRLVLNQGRG